MSADGRWDLIRRLKGKHALYSDLLVLIFTATSLHSSTGLSMVSVITSDSSDSSN
jgi:hypothetical protein